MSTAIGIAGFVVLVLVLSAVILLALPWLVLWLERYSNWVWRRGKAQ